MHKEECPLHCLTVPYCTVCLGYTRRREGWGSWEKYADAVLESVLFLYEGQGSTKNRFDMKNPFWKTRVLWSFFGKQEGFYISQHGLLQGDFQNCLF
jgi:predicted Fe-S protein YdhL (DUF1289 family)